MPGELTLIQDLLAAVGVILNGVPQGLLALALGFAAFPTALAFIVGIVGVLIFNSVAPISFQAETITLAARLSDDRREVLTAIFFGGAVMAVLGYLGLLQTIVDLVGPSITNAVMAGVGIMLAYVAIEIAARERAIGIVSIIVALVVWITTASLVHTIVWSVVVAGIAGRFIRFEPVQADAQREKLRLQPLYWRFWQHPRVIRGALALVTLNIGANITFGNITGQIAGQPVDVDKLAIYSSLADMASSLFGGAPVESIISATADAPNPILSGVLMMGIFAVLLLARLLPVIGRFVPQASIAGFLLVLGAIVTLPTNLQLAFQDVAVNSPMAAVLGMTIISTARFDPFVGIVTGVILRAGLMAMGVLP